ncbi:hypothetical protein BDY21DRAFT_47627 [Lineolata rhizophorae]|uniref:U3 snoRNA associated-domain-containing protein n=1 Tax=Lineolata rhizophorae TaxID=578093 RepID=A0A6A6NWX4_9PEZI|nr:hypothetical protein BDY21DRAFT_47627 [Lineolata rhizophorae]
MLSRVASFLRRSATPARSSPAPADAADTHADAQTHANEYMSQHRDMPAEPGEEGEQQQQQQGHKRSLDEAAPPSKKQRLGEGADVPAVAVVGEGSSPDHAASQKPDAAATGEASAVDGKALEIRTVESSTRDRDDGDDEGTEPEDDVVQQHVRFRSKSPPEEAIVDERAAHAVPRPSAEPDAAAETSDEQQKAWEGEDESSDEAPEAISGSAAADLAKAAQKGASKAIQEQEAKAKRSRRTRDELLKTQAAGSFRKHADKAKSKKRKRGGASDTSSDEEERPPPLRLASEHITSGYALPAELLNSIDEVRPPTPPRLEATPAQKTHIKFAEGPKAGKTPKDVKRGPVSVRVLDEQNPVLAPKADGAMRSVRERWLMGREGQGSRRGRKERRRPAANMERKGRKRGFLRQ